MPDKTIIGIGKFLLTQVIVSDSIEHIPISILSLWLYRQILYRYKWLYRLQYRAYSDTNTELTIL